MLRGVALRVVVATMVMLAMLVAAFALSTDGVERARPPLGEVRIEKILDFQLPEV